MLGVVVFRRPYIQKHCSLLDLFLHLLRVDHVRQGMFDELDKVLFAQPQQHAIREHHDRAAAWLIGEQRLLAKALTRSKLSQLNHFIAVIICRALHATTTLVDQIEEVTFIADVDDHITRYDFLLLHAHHHALDIRGRYLLKHAGVQQLAHPVIGLFFFEF